MGEFTQNLLKLTEFPFSYSLMGLLSIIFGHGTNLEELSLARIGPLLILMGFVATTLAICDPLGALQRLIIKGRDLQSRSPIGEFKTLLEARIFGYPLFIHFPGPYIISIRYSPEDVLRQRYDVDWNSVLKELLEFGPLQLSVIPDELNKISSPETIEIGHLLEGLKHQAVKTKWITAEVDRITALIYFMIVISVFMAAILLLPDLLQKFAQVFEDIELVRIGILIFSILALIAVSIMFVSRMGGLLDKAGIVFRYLTALGAIKVDVERFKVRLEEIERYLNDNDWTLAEYWVKRIQLEYSEVFIRKVISSGRTPKKPRGQ